MAVNLLRRLAAAAPVPVFVARGTGVGLWSSELAADPRLRLVTSPRHATVLLAAGDVDGDLGDALDRVHDQMPHPRARISCTADMEHRHVASMVVEAHRTAVLEAAGDFDALANRPPNPFEGRGEHGQGGEGMMGGVPYGRPMAMTGHDRDGLSLDQLTFQLGPFLVGLPNRVAIDLTLQGEVVQHAALRVVGADGRITDPVTATFASAGSEPVEVAVLERCRARHQLRWIAEVCRLAGLVALSARVARVAVDIDAATASAARSLGRAVRHSGLCRSWSNVGRLPAGSPALRGPSARAVDVGGDARARLEQRLAETASALDHAAAAAAACQVHDPDEPLEPPWGEPPAEPTGMFDAVGSALAGMDWADALITVASLDLPTDSVHEPVGPVT